MQLIKLLQFVQTSSAISPCRTAIRLRKWLEKLRPCLLGNTNTGVCYRKGDLNILGIVRIDHSTYCYCALLREFVGATVVSKLQVRKVSAAYLEMRFMKH